jgi:transposase
MGKLREAEIVCAEVLLGKGRSVRSIAADLGVDESTVRYRLRRRREHAGDGRREKTEVCGAFSDVIAVWIAGQTEKIGRPESVRLLYELLVAEHGFTGTYKSVLRYVRRRTPRPAIRPIRRVETRPGMQAQVDWVQSKLLSIDDLGGPVRLQAFVITLSFSRMWAVIWSARQDLLAWLECHNAALIRLGGVPATVRIDNLKTGVVAGGGPWAVLNEGYASYANQMGFLIDPCRIRQPGDKGKVERRGRDVKELMVREGERFASVAGLQTTTDERIQSRSQRLTCPVTGESIAASWAIEQPALSALPPTLPAPFDVQVHRRVGRDSLVAFEGRQYSVPFRFIGRTIDVRGCAGRVEIYAGGDRIATFPRQTACRLLVDQAHYEGAADGRVASPVPLGYMARQIVAPKSWEAAGSRDVSVAKRPIDHYQRLLESLS